MALSANPWNKQAFETQICAIVLAPTLICISIYLTLKHLCTALNPTLSRLRPKWYPVIFVPFDVSCLLVQAIGGAIAASAGSTNERLLSAGNHAIIAGIALQVVVLLLFGTLSADYYVRVRRWMRSGEVTPEALALWRDRKFRMFGGAVLGAYICVQIRCIYRYGSSLLFFFFYRDRLWECYFICFWLTQFFCAVLLKWREDGATTLCRTSHPSRYSTRS